MEDEPTRPEGAFNDVALSQQPSAPPTGPNPQGGYIQLGEIGDSWLGVDDDDWAIAVSDRSQAVLVVTEYDSGEMYLRKADQQVYLTFAAALSKDLNFHPWLGFSVWISSNPWRFNDGPGDQTLEATGHGAYQGYKVIEAGTELWWLKPGYLGGAFGSGDDVWWIAEQ